MSLSDQPMVEPCQGRVLFIHGLDARKMLEFMDKYEKRNLKLVCYEQSEDPIAHVLSHRELSICTSDIVLILPDQLKYDSATRATLISAMDFRESQDHKTLLIQVGDKKWRAPPEAAFIRLDDLRIERIDSIEDVVSETFMNTITEYIRGEKDIKLPDVDRPQYGRGLAWNFMFGFIFNIMEKPDHKEMRPPLMIRELRDYLTTRPDMQPVTSRNLYLIIPFNPKLDGGSEGVMKAHLVADKAVSIITNYAGLERPYNLSLYKFGPPGEEVYSLVSLHTQLDPFFKMVCEGTNTQFKVEDLNGCKTRFLAELHRILRSHHCTAFRDNVQVIIHQSEEEDQHVCDSLYALISSDVKTRRLATLDTK